MNVWIMTDMEGLAGVDDWMQCYAETDDDPRYRYGLSQLVADVNAAIEGAVDAGAETIWVCDGHGRNGSQGFEVVGGLHPRATKAPITHRDPTRFDHLDGEVDAVAMIGQHAMAGTINGFLDHTQSPKQICRFLINGREAGELTEFAMYAGHHGVPLVYASGDEALCDEAQRIIPGIVTTPTKRGTGWATCELENPDAVRRRIREDMADALRTMPTKPLYADLPITIQVEWAWSELAEPFARIPGVERIDGRTVRWQINDARDVFSWPNPNWHPLIESLT